MVQQDNRLFNELVKPANSWQPQDDLKPYDFQLEDVKRMESMKDVLLFSEMGTGKTIEAIVHVMRHDYLPALIVCPNSLKLNWWDEIFKWTGIESYYCESLDELVEGYFEHAVGKKIFFIIHHEALAYIRDDPVRKMVQLIGWQQVIVDESHRFRNMNARTEELMEMKGAKRWMFITGTPIVNSTYDLYPMLKTIGRVETEGEFLRNFTYGQETQWGYKPLGSKNRDALLVKLADIWIRRLKSEVLKDLPPKNFIPMKLQMPADQRKVYDAFEEMMAIEIDSGNSLAAAGVLDLLIRLRQLSLDPNILGKNTDSAKTRAIIELIDQSEATEKWVVASTSKQYVNFLSKKLNEKNIGNVLYTGDTHDVRERYNLEQSFKNNPMTRVFLTTYFTGGLGLNLQHCHKMILTDYWWNRMTIDQQVDRLHRPGQDTNVDIYDLENEDSIDQTLKETVNRKQAIAEEFVVNQETIKSIYKRRRGFDFEPTITDKKDLTQ